MRKDKVKLKPNYRMVTLLYERDICPMNLANEMGISRTSVYAWMNGRYEMKLGMLAKFTDVMNLSPNELYEYVTGKEYDRV